MSTWQFPRADVVRVIDGDNLELAVTYDIDLGFDDRQIITRRRSFRLYGLNVRELDQPGGLEAFRLISGMLPAGTQLSLTSVKLDKFGGRYDAIVTLPGGLELNAWLIANQWAAQWNGRGPKPVPPWPRTVAD